MPYDPTTAPDYVCAVCTLPIVDEEPHTDHRGEDVHADCCAICDEDQAAREAETS